jgi:hypothetical protein
MESLQQQQHSDEVKHFSFFSSGAFHHDGDEREKNIVVGFGCAGKRRSHIKHGTP